MERLMQSLRKINYAFNLMFLLRMSLPTKRLSKSCWVRVLALQDQIYGK